LTFADWENGSDVARTSDVRESVGGKATNAARAVTCAGGRATVIGFAGGDTGEQMIQLLRGEGLHGIWIPVQAETRFCQTLLNAKGQRIRELVEEAKAVTPEEWAELFDQAQEALKKQHGLLLCGSLPRGAPPDVYATLARLAHEAGQPVGIDAKGEELLLALREAPELVKINRSELQAATGERDIGAGIMRLIDLGVRQVMITDGPRPAWIHDGERFSTLSLPEIEPVNPIGGGDTVTGVTFYHLVRGTRLKEAAAAGLGAGMAQTLTPRPAIFDLAKAETLAGKIRIEDL
jgi:1-phosphofructokinase family hexose kinase